MPVRSVPLGELIEPAPVERANERLMPILSMTMRVGLVNQELKFKKRVASADTSQYKVVNRHQLVVGLPIDEGVLSFQEIYDRAIVSPAYSIWNITDNVEIESGYLERFLRSPRALAYYRSKLRGTTARRRTLPSATFLSMPVIVPPVAVQRYIVNVLEKVEFMQAKRREALVRLDELIQATFLEMFGELSANPYGWKKYTCQEVCRRIAVGIVFRPASYYQESGISALRSLNILPNLISTKSLVYFSAQDNETRLAKTRVRAGDVVLVRSGQPGTAAVIPDELDGVNSIDILITTPDQSKISSTFLSFYFNSPAGKRMVVGEQRGQIQKHLNVSSLKVASIPVPPLALQHEFAQRVATIERVKEKNRMYLAELDELFESLQYRAFRGEL